MTWIALRMLMGDRAKYLGLIFGVIDLRFGVLGLVVFTEGPVHIDRSDFERPLRPGR